MPASLDPETRRFLVAILVVSVVLPCFAWISVTFSPRSVIWQLACLLAGAAIGMLYTLTYLAWVKTRELNKQRAGAI